MSDKLTILYFGINPWHTTKQRPQQIADRLAHNNEVLYFDPIVDPLSMIISSSKIRTSPTGFFAKTRVTRMKAGLTLIESPGLVPAGQFISPLRKFEELVFNERLSRFLNKRTLGPDVLWLSHPSQAFALDLLGSQMICCYDCMDDYSLMAPHKADEIRNMERKIFSRADLVFASSRSLEEKCRREAKNVHRIPNGAEPGDFSMAASRCGSGVKSSRVIGFFGAIGPYLDLNLLVKIASHNPSWKLKMIGRCYDKSYLRTLRKYPNVELVGAVPYEKLRMYVSDFDVCILPFRMDALGQSVNPVKMYEYLATGKPIVSVDLMEARDFIPEIRIARNDDEFIAELEFALDDFDEQMSLRRVHLAYANTWQQRVDSIEAAIHNLTLTRES